VALTANFFLPRLMPGNAVQTIMGHMPGLQPAAAKALEVELGIGHQGSLLSQYGTYLVNVAHLNFGVDVAQFPTPVSSLLWQFVPWTLVLVGVSTIVSFVVGTGLGILAGWRSGGSLDKSLPGFMFVQSIPYFFLALILVLVFAQTLQWLPIGQTYDASAVTMGWNWPFIANALQHAILPAVTIILTSVAGWMLQMRNVMVTTVGEDYVLAAQAKGLSNRRVIGTYAARNALLPQLQGFGLAIGFVVSGALVMEIVFSYQGVGYNLLQAVTGHDYPMMQAIFLFITFAVLLANLIVDLLIVAIDPRARAKEA
jgi:peptide/nickel transport system permease protein